jgi:hypothetical protein
MNKAPWSPEEHDEYEELLSDVWNEPGISTRDRVKVFLTLLDDAVQGHRPWANDLERTCLELGAATHIKGWRKRQKEIVFDYQGQPLTRSAVVGFKRVSDDGSSFDEQRLIHYGTWDELIEKRREYLAQQLAYSANVAYLDRLLALHDLVPDAANPHEAAEALGTTVEEWLAGNIEAIS